DALGNGEQAGEIHCRVPAGIETTKADDTDGARTLPQLLKAIERTLHLVLAANDADEVLHHLLQVLLDLIRTFVASAADVAVERLQRATDGFFDLRGVDLARVVFLRVLRGKFPGALAED